MKFSLVIPCYNEGKNIPLLLERCAYLLNQVSDAEVILVDNGSTDETSDVLSKLLPEFPGCRSIRVEVNQGYGFGILSGLSIAQGEFLGWTHADMQTDPYDVVQGLNVLSAVQSDCFIKGRRLGRPWGDVLFTVGMSIFESILLRKILWDINAQPNIFSKQFYESWSDPPYDFSLDLYAYFKAKEENLNIYRFPVNFSKRVHGMSHWNISWSAKMKFIKRTVEFSLQLRKKLHSTFKTQ